VPLTYPADLALLREHWPNATSTLMSDEVAERIATVAELGVIAWAPAGTVADATNPAYVLAVAMHAADVANAASREGDPVNADGWVVRPRPLRDEVRAILRPSSPVPAVG
jgi:hypothetical protein